MEIEEILEKIPNKNVEDDDVHTATILGVDYSSEFTTDEIFESKDALVNWARLHGVYNEFVVVTKRLDLGGVGKRRARITLCCERSGEYKPSKKKNVSDTQDCDKKKKETRETGTKKCGCPFLLRGKNIGDGDQWKLRVVFGMHNHTNSEYLEGHSFAGRLTNDENEVLVTMSRMMVRPRDILNVLKEKDETNVSTMKIIYNAKQRWKKQELDGRTQMQQLLKKFSDHNYMEHHKSSEPDNCVTDLFWTHPINVQILRSFPEVLIMDCTYKVNRYRLPLLEIVGVTSTKMTFSVEFAFINHEKEENFTWALSRLKTLFCDGFLPKVIMTDRDQALLNAVGHVFPTSQNKRCK